MEKTKNLYYLYHIPGKKIGMTRNIEGKEKHWQEWFGYKKDLNPYDKAKNSPINQFKSNKTMYTNVTDQTTTFNVPVNKLKGYLMDNLGHTFETSYGKYTMTPELVRIIVNNARESMYRNTACYIYNKVLFEETNKTNNLGAKDFDPNNIYDLIRQWASDRGIYTSGDSKTQYTKLCEESGELARAILKKDKAELTDAIGDMIVVLTNLAALEGLKVEECVVSAYNVIKSRQGSMVNGTFVKDNTGTTPSLTNHIQTTL